ncbi:MAG: hypothetical protein ACYSSO_04370 [Planctomycetota bacterium]|jgi:hypothetical protein
MESQQSRDSEKSMGEMSQAGAGEAELVLEQDEFGLGWLDWLLAPVIAVLVGVWAFAYVGTSTYWDDLLYMNLSQYTTPRAIILNRYGHIYLQKFFFWLAGDCITGGRVYWCFIFFSTCVLVYWCAKILAGKRGYIVGLVAVSFFCAQSVFIKYLGCTLADFTVMFLVTLGTFVYLAFPAGGRKHRHLFIMILGLIFFWVMKSKETGICMAVLFLGLGEDGTGSFGVRRFVRDIGWACLGMLGGLVLLMVLDFSFMGDAWFSIRPSSIRDLLAFNVAEFAHEEYGGSVYRLSSRYPILAAFLLYLFIGWKGPGGNRQRHNKAAWFVPLALMFFSIAVTIRVKAISELRAFVPAVPGVCMWGAQFFRFRARGPEEPSSLLKKLIGPAIMLSALIIVAVVMHKTPELVKNTGWKSVARFYVCTILPLATTGLLICASLLKKRGLAAQFILWLCLFFVIYFPVRNNLTTLKKGTKARKSAWRFMPYHIFAGELRFDKDVTILVSKDVHARSWMLGREVQSHCWMFNIFFNQKFEVDQFIDGSWEDIIKGDYTYAILTYADLKGINEKYGVEQLENYTSKFHREKELVLLKKH